MVLTGFESGKISIHVYKVIYGKRIFSPILYSENKLVSALNTQFQ